jgi:hypothetical protein
MFDTLGRFMRRPTHDDQYSSICTRCFATVGFSRIQEDLDEIERKHVCDKDVLSRLRILAGGTSGDGS